MSSHPITVTRPVKQSFADFYLTSDYSQFPQEHRSYKGGGINAFVADQTAHNFTDIASPEWILGFPLRAACPTRFDYGDGWRRSQRGRGDFLLVPPGTEVRYEIGGPTKLLVLTWPAGLLKSLDDQIFGDELLSLEALTGRYFKSTAIESICRSIWSETARTDAPAQVMLEGLVAQLAGWLARSAGQHKQAPAHRRCEVRRVVGYIEDNLQNPLSLGDMAAVAGLSVFHFAREFQIQVGDAPYRFVQKRRAARATQLLSQTTLTPDDVARRAGFGSVRTMRSTLRRYPQQLIEI